MQYRKLIGWAFVGVALLSGPLFWNLMNGQPAPAPVAPIHGAPWQIDIKPSGSSRVFDVEIGSTRMAEIQARWKDGVRVAVVASSGELGALEAYVEQADAAGVMGRMIFSFDLEPTQLQAYKERATRSETVTGGARRFALAAADTEQAAMLPVAAIAFIPNSQLDPDMIYQRFGKPAMVQLEGQNLKHFLYPGKGLCVTLDAKGRELLQYVAPSNFDRLSAPLAQLPASS